MAKRHHYVYILQCRDDTLYTGYTTDLIRRLGQHNRGKGARYTKGRIPVRLVYWEQVPSKELALAREHAIKRLSRKEKLMLIRNQGGGTAMLKVAFVCIHNSCRSQMAEALAKYFTPYLFVPYSAGTEPAARINPDAVRILKDLYGLDLEKDQYPKSVAQLPPVDLVITMGCGVTCPTIPHRYREDWGIPDPTGQKDEAFIHTARLIETKIKELRRRLLAGELVLD